jgi:hypothetical protein
VDIAEKSYFCYNERNKNMKTKTASAVQDPQPLFTAEQLYNELMWHIEPELMIENIQHLDEMYAGETPEERTKRFEYYAHCFSTFDQCLADLQEIWQSDAGFIGNVVEAYAKDETSYDESAAVRGIEDSLDQDA